MPRSPVGTTRNVYLHEIIDIVGEGAMPYMELTAARGAGDASGGTLGLVGTWYTMGSTGRWPQVINLWECVDGWNGWRALMERTNLRRTRTPELEDWWRDALKVRTGGIDRVMAGAPGCPSMADLTAAEIHASVFVHELSRCRAGAALEYLAAVRSEWAPIAAEYGHTLVGSYEVLLTDTEVMTIWATSTEDHCRYMEAATEGTDARIATWRARAREFLTEWREELMTPYPGTLMSAGDSL
ncbi:MAG TPA: hypothetical protein VFW06_01885 [Acidimicrobiia bacterium]|nr:hypothetical protein [Acidimicrobiia bacterium]